MRLAVLIPVLAISASLAFGQRGGGRGGVVGGGFGGPRGPVQGGPAQIGGGGFNGTLPAPPMNPYNMGPRPFSAAGQAAASLPGAGFGSVVFPSGTGSFGSIGLGSITGAGVFPYSQTFAGRLGAVVAGTGVPLGSGGFIGRGGAYPVFVGSGFIGGNYAYPEQPAQITIINQQPPAVIVNPDYRPDPPARPTVQMYDADGNPVNTISIPVAQVPEGRPIRQNANGVVENVPDSDEPTIYLLALKDGSIYASYAYWVERDTVHYITPGHAHNQVSLDRIDMALTRRLNKDKQLDLR